MIWIWVLAGAVLLGFTAIQLGFVPPPLAITLVRFRNGRLEIRKGQLRPYAREQVAGLLREANVVNCFIAVTSQNLVLFSRTIPSSIHQRLRNVILNQ
jgi:hypothetical protein